MASGCATTPPPVAGSITSMGAKLAEDEAWPFSSSQLSSPVASPLGETGRSRNDTTIVLLATKVLAGERCGAGGLVWFEKHRASSLACSGCPTARGRCTASRAADASFPLTHSARTIQFRREESPLLALPLRRSICPPSAPLVVSRDIALG